MQRLMTRLNANGGVVGALKKTLQYSDLRAGVLIGTDHSGNKYYEDKEDTPHPRHRWVEFASDTHGVSRQFKHDATSVPSQWHAWLHHMTDLNGDEVEKQFGQPWSAKNAKLNETGNMDKVYVPPGFVLHEHFKDELKQRAENIWSEFDPKKGPVSVSPVVEKNLDELD